MNKYIGCVLFLMFFGGFVSAQNPPRVTVVNNTGYTMYALYIIQSANDDAHENLLRGRVLRNGESYQVRLRYPLNVKTKCHIRLEDGNGNTYSKFHVSLRSDNRIVFIRNDFDGDFGGIAPPFDWWEDDDLDFDDIGPPPPIPPGW